MNRRSALLLLAIALCVLPLLSGCGAKNQMAELTANPWVVTQILTAQGHDPVLPGSAPTIDFRSDGAVVGNATLNVFNGLYTVKGRSVQIGPLGATAWVGPQMEIQQDQLVLSSLASTKRYVIQKGVLQLSDGSGQLLMSLEVAPQPKLAGPTWVCTSLVSATGELASVAGSSPVVAAFAPDATLTGSGGVNSYSTKYGTSGSQMRIGPDITSTKMAGPEPATAQETRYFDTLIRVASYKIEGYKLTLFDKFGIPSVVYIPGAAKY